MITVPEALLPNTVEFSIPHLFTGASFGISAIATYDRGTVWSSSYLTLAGRSTV